MEKYLRDQRRSGAIAEIARVKFPFPNAEHPELETIANEPKQQVSVGEHEGKALYPDIVVIRRPGLWLTLMAEVEMADSVTGERALERWLPISRFGDLLLYVPSGMASEAKKICRRHGIKTKGIRTWRFRPVWGLSVAEA